MSCVYAVPRRLLALLILGLSATALLVSPAAADDATRQVSARQERVVLGLIDDICGDTWCEGDFAFDFRRFSCDSHERSCDVTLRIARYDRDPLVYHWRTREVHGFRSFGQLVVTAPSGQQSLTPAFYAAVNVLILDVEASVPVCPTG